MTWEARPTAGLTEGHTQPRGLVALVFAPAFGPFFWGKMFSFAGIWIFTIVGAMVAYDLTGSALTVGLVSAVQFAPQLLLAPLSGKMADRGNAPRQIIVGQLLTGAGSLGLALWIWLAGGTDGLPGAGPVVAASLVVGFGFVVGGPAIQSVVPRLIRPGEMASAMALNSVPSTIGRAGGPAVGAMVATQLGSDVAFAMAGAANIIFALVVAALHLPGNSAHPSETDFSIRAALRHLRVDRVLGVLLIGITAVGIGADPAVTLAPALASDLAGDAGLVGWLTSSFGIGAGLGFLLFAAMHRRVRIEKLTSAGLLLMAAGFATAAVVPLQSVALVAFGVSGLGMTWALTAITTQIQNRSPESLRGRIMALWLVGLLGARPFASGLNGFLADAVSVSVALLVASFVVAMAAYFCRPSRLGVAEAPQDRYPVP